MNKLRIWLIDKLIGKKPYMANVYFISTVAIDHDKCKGIRLLNVEVDLGHDKKIPHGTGYYIARNVPYHKDIIRAKIG